MPSQPPITQAWPAPAHLFGDWGGFQTELADLGITYSLTYTAESVANLSGGLRAEPTTPTRSHGESMSTGRKSRALLDSPRNIINRAGRNASADNIGDTVIQTQEIYGAGFGVGAKLVWFYGEEKLFNDRLNITFGRFAPGTDFNASPLYCNFMTLTICGHDRALIANQGFEDWPMSVWATRIRVRPS